MKTAILLTTVVLFTSSFLHAQIEKGRVQIGGSISASQQQYDATDFNPELKSTYLSFSPSIGHFYKTNRLAGLFLDFSYAKNTNTSFYISRNYGGGVYFRQYKPVINKLSIFLDERGGYNYFNNDGNTYSSYGYSINASLQMGMAYDIAKKMQLELSLNNLIYASYNNANNTEGYAINTSLEKNVFSNIGFGFRYYLK